MALNRSDNAHHGSYPWSKNKSPTRFVIDCRLDREIQCLHLPFTQVCPPEISGIIITVFLSPCFSIHELAAWLTHFVSHRVTLATHYESWAFILVHGDNDLFERVTNQLEKLSPLPFRLKYIHSSHVIPASRASTTAGTASAANQRPSSLLPKRFNVRAWLRDRKTQIKISPREPQAPSASSSSTSSSSITKVPSLTTLHPPSAPVKSIPSASAKHVSTVLPPAPPPQPNVSLRRKIGSIPVPKRNQTVH